MNQRELQNSGNVIWTCIQAFSGTNGEAAKEAAEKATSDGRVTVVCTPSGGEQTVRLQLPQNWMDDMSDEALLEALMKERNGR